MKPFFLSIIILALSIPVHVFSQTTGNGGERNILRQLEYDWLIAEFKLDTATISGMMDEKFISIGIDRNSNKQEELDGIYKNIAQRIKDNHIVDSLYLDNVDIMFHGNTAIVTFTSVTKGKIKDVPFTNRRTRFYDVWIKKNGKWKAVSSQGTPVK